MKKVIITDRMEEKDNVFEYKNTDSIGFEAEENNIEIPFSCRAGACRTCLCTVLDGLDYIDREAFGMQCLPTDDNEILACIAGLKPDTPDNIEIKLRAENM